MTVVAPDQICGRLGDTAGALPLTDVEIESTIVGLLATTVVRQTFLNSRSEAIEATYIFPLPDRAGVTGFVADIAGRRVVAELREREAARAAYEAAVAAGHRSAIAEEERSGVFTIRVGNLQPGESAVITLNLSGPVAVDDGIAEHRLPLVVAPRYIPGQPLEDSVSGSGTEPDTDAVPDASRITPATLLPGQKSPVRLRLVARFPTWDDDERGAAAPTCTVPSSSQPGDGGFALAVEPGQRLDRDIVIRWPVAAEELVTSAVITPDPDVPGEGTWTVTVVPPRMRKGVSPRDVVIVLDRSGSMGGWKMVAARRAAARVIDSLNSRDRFAVVAFDNVGETPRPESGLAPATDAERWAAVEWLAGLRPRGGTEMLQPLANAAQWLGIDATARRERFLVLITDGQVGNEDQILEAMSPVVGRARIFALGIDRAVNVGFLRRLAAMGAGRCELVESEARLDDVVATLHRRIAPPVLRDLEVTADGITIDPAATSPARSLDVFPGSVTVVSGRYTASDGVTPSFRIRGSGMDLAVAAVVSATPAMRTAWARAHIRDLEDLYASGSGNRGLEGRIVTTSLRYGVLSRFTAYVAVDTSRTTVVGDASLSQPVELPSGWLGPLGATTIAFGAAPLMRSRSRGAGPQAALTQGTTAGLDFIAAGRIERAAPVSAAPFPSTGQDAVDLSTYLTRVAAVLDRLAAGEELSTEVEELLEDVESVSAGSELAVALRLLLTQLRSAHDTAAQVQRLRVLVGALPAV